MEDALGVIMEMSKDSGMVDDEEIYAARARVKI
jgi:hypothetical protein